MLSKYHCKYSSVALELSAEEFAMPTGMHIDMLSVIDEKTKGNLSEEETRLLAGSLYELRQRYIQLVEASRAV